MKKGGRLPAVPRRVRPRLQPCAGTWQVAINVSPFPFLSVLFLSAEQGVLPAVFAATSPAAGSAAAIVALSVAGAAARPAASGHHRHFVLRTAGVLFPAAAEVFAGLFLVACIAFPVVAGISGPAWGCRCLEVRGAQHAAGRSGAPR